MSYVLAKVKGFNFPKSHCLLDLEIITFIIFIQHYTKSTVIYCLLAIVLIKSFH